jgi:hypothetical protein
MQKIGGRQKGVPNIHTRGVRFAIGEAARRVGGIDRLVAWIMESVENERLFWTQIWPRLLPLRIEGSGEHGEIELNVEIRREDLARRLAERGLPPMVFGIDVPTLEAPRIETNGASEPEAQ